MKNLDYNLIDFCASTFCPKKLITFSKDTVYIKKIIGLGLFGNDKRFESIDDHGFVDEKCCSCIC